MRQNPSFVLGEIAESSGSSGRTRGSTMVSHTDAGELVASHYPVILDESADDEIVLLSHVGRPDEQLHELGAHELLVIVQGPHGYISPGWYDAKPAVPTWNFVDAHLYGTPELLSDDENLRGSRPPRRPLRGPDAGAPPHERHGGTRSTPPASSPARSDSGCGSTGSPARTR